MSSSCILCARMCVHGCVSQRETEKSSAFCVWGLPGSVQAVAARRNSNSNTCDTDELKSHMFNQHHFKKLLHSLVAVLANYSLKGEFILSCFNVAEQVVTVTFTSQSLLSHTINLVMSFATRRNVSLGQVSNCLVNVFPL